MTPQPPASNCPHCGSPAAAHDAVCLHCGQTMYRTAPARPTAPPQSADYIRGIDPPPAPETGRGPSDDPKRLALALGFLGVSGLLLVWWLTASGTLAALLHSPKILAGVGVTVALLAAWGVYSRWREKELTERLRSARTLDGKLATLDAEIEANRRRAEALRKFQGKDGPP